MRRHRRVRRVRPAVLRSVTPGAEEKPPVSTYLRVETISRGGALLRCDAEISPGTSLDLEICLAGGVIRARARALYSYPLDDGFAVGVEFVELGGAGDERLLELLVTSDDGAAPGGGSRPT